MVGLVLEPELGGLELPRDAGARETRLGVVPPGEEVVVVDAEPPRLSRSVRRHAADLQPLAAQPVELAAEVLRRIDAPEQRRRREVAVPADLVPVLVLESPKRVGERRVVA